MIVVSYFAQYCEKGKKKIAIVLNCSVKKGDVLYKTNNEYKKNGVKYIEVYNDNVWGYVSENNIK